MSFKTYATLFLAAAHHVAAQLVDDTWVGPGNVYVVQGDDMNRPSDPSTAQIGCVNVDGKLIAADGACAVFQANVTHLYSDAGECGWELREGTGGQPYLIACTTPTPTDYGFYRINNKQTPIYLSYGAGQIGWSVDGTPTGDETYDINWGSGAAKMRGILLWSPL